MIGGVSRLGVVIGLCASHSKEWVASVGEDKQCVISEIKDGSTIKALCLSPVTSDICGYAHNVRLLGIQPSLADC